MSGSLKSLKSSVERAVRYMKRAKDELEGVVGDSTGQDDDPGQRMDAISSKLQLLQTQCNDVNGFLTQFERQAAESEETEYDNDQMSWGDALYECQSLMAEAQRKVRALSQSHSQQIAANPLGDQATASPAASGQSHSTFDQQFARLLILMEQQQTSVASAPPTPMSANGAPNAQAQYTKLPRMEMPKFSGDILKWRPFWHRFQASVDKNTMLAPVDKLNYLISMLEKEALSLVESLPMTDENYDTAKTLLESKYADQKMVIALLYRRLNEMKPVKNDVNILRRFVADLDCLMGSLESMGQNTSDDNFTTIILSKLPKDIVIMLEMDKPVDTAWTVALVRSKLSDYLVRVERADKVSAIAKASDRGSKPDATGDSFFAQDGSKKFNKKGGKRWPEKPPGQNAKKEPQSSKCVYCKGNHYSDQCSRFSTADFRYAQLKGRCTVCLSEGHKRSECKSQKPCYYCKQKQSHHSSLCFSKFGRNAQANLANDGQKSPIPNPPQPIIQPNDGTGLLAAGEEALLQMAKIPVRCAKTRGQPFHGYRTLLDPGSNRSYGSEDLANHLGMKLTQGPTLSVNVFGSDRPVHVSTKVGNLELKLLNGRIAVIAVTIIPKITGRLVRVPIDSRNLDRIQSRLRLADEITTKYESSPVDLLIGSDYYLDFISGEKISIGPGLYLLGSEFGYILSGRIASEGQDPSLMALCGITSSSLDDLADIMISPTLPSSNDPVLNKAGMSKFWSLEDIGIKDDPAKDSDELAAECFNKTVTIDNGRYSVGLPWNQKAEELKCDYNLSVGRLNSLVKKLKNNDTLFDQYAKIMQDQLEKGVIEKVEMDSNPAQSLYHYIPHHAVVQPERETTKVRVVYDGSARSQRNSPSLNECLYRGPILLEDLVGLLMRFRTHRIAIIADIEKAFLQIGINPMDRDKLRFLWLREPQKRTSENNLQIYRFSRVVFGLNCSPSLLAQTVQYHLKSQDDPISNQLTNDLYVDNLITGVETVEDAKTFYTKAKQIFQRASMNLRQWTSNSADFMSEIPQQDHVKVQAPKVLGLQWEKEADRLAVTVKQKLKDRAETKREFLSQLASVFDPLGLFTPVTITGKICLQMACETKPKWDSKMDSDLINEWEVQKDKLCEIDSVSVPRYVLSDGQCSLIAFCDASTSCFATAIYLKCGSEVNLVLSKTRLNPSKRLTIPRLELMAVLIGVRALNFALRHLKLKVKEAVLFSDSKCALAWLTNQKDRDIFVKNRVKEISKSKWIRFRYVHTEENPADWATRGKRATELTDFWWKGPPWVAKCSADWPTWDFVEISKAQESDSSTPAMHEASLVSSSPPLPPFGIEIERFSSHLKLVRVTSLCQRFLNNLRRSNSSADCLSAQELSNSKLLWEKAVQSQSYEKIIQALKAGKNHEMSHLQLFLDKNDLLRCQCRLGRADISYGQKYPKLLPKSHPYTGLLVKYLHEHNGHASVAHTQAILRMEYWVPKARQLIKSICSKCVICRRAIGRPFSLPKMPELPADRVNPQACFESTGVDYFGPVKLRGSAKTEKAYVVLFTCLSTRAVHLELACDLSAEEFLTVFRRFIARRGKPAFMISDNGPQFKTVSRSIDLAWPEAIKDALVMKFSADEGISWKFIVAYAPYMGGVYERLVGIVKTALRKTVGQALMTHREFETLLFEAEALINTRPLTSVNTGINEAQVLTPAHFLSLNPRIALPPLTKNVQSEVFRLDSLTAESLIRSWKKGQNLLNEFWKEWKTAYLNALSSRMRYDHAHNQGCVTSPTVGEIVLLKHSGLPRGTWKLARITKIHASTDRQVRSVTVLLPTGRELTRPINLIVPLEVRANIPNDPDIANMDDKENLESGRASPEL